MSELTREFNKVADNIAFKNHTYQNIFSDKLIVVYNQLPGVSSLINLATTHSNPVLYM